MIISFPHLGDYSVVIIRLLMELFPHARIMPPPPITKKTLELGSKFSPDFVCVPFKYNLGNYIEALDNGATVLMQAGGGCRFGFYGELQNQILRDLGYEFEFINLFAKNITAIEVYKSLKKVGLDVSFIRFISTFLFSVRLLRGLDYADFYIRENIGFEVNKGEFMGIRNDFFASVPDIKTHSSLKKQLKEYNQRLKAVPIDKPKNCLKIGIIGELYTQMEANSNFFLERELAKQGAQIARYTNATYLLFEKSKRQKRVIKDAGGYIDYNLGADGAETVMHANQLAKSGFDGLIHVKPFGCMPEVNAIPSLININKDYKIPILYFSFDQQTSEVGVRTRLEAFFDMLKMKEGDRVL